MHTASQIYVLWSIGCARALELLQFLIGDIDQEERQPAVNLLRRFPRPLL